MSAAASTRARKRAHSQGRRIDRAVSFSRGITADLRERIAPVDLEWR
jgi:hypothetical protein